jgi:GNAT superfamily N-acetyltransferase
VIVQAVVPDERVATFYRSTGYTGQAQPSDRVFVAVDGEEWLAIVRLALENGVTVLRGMRVLPSHQRRGIGRELLRASCETLDGQPCYCLPFVHLVGFYGQAGFREIDPAGAPRFLTERLADYRGRRPEPFTLMHRA